MYQFKRIHYLMANNDLNTLTSFDDDRSLWDKNYLNFLELP